MIFLDTANGQLILERWIVSREEYVAHITGGSNMLLGPINMVVFIYGGIIPYFF